MAATIITRMVAKTEEHDSAMTRAAQTVGKYMDSANSAEGVVKSLMGTFGKYVTVMGAVTTAVGVAKDAFLATEGGIDAMGKATKQCEGAYNAFLQTLNGGNWSNFFTNLNDAINGAGALYDALDRLGSIKANNSAAIAIEQKALAEARLKLKEAEAKGDKAHVKALQEEIKTHQQRLSGLRNDEVNATKNAGKVGMVETLRTAYQSQDGAGTIADSSLRAVADNLLKGGQSAFDHWAKVADDLGKKAESTRTRTVTGSGGISQSYTETYTDWNKLSKNEQAQLRMARAVTNAETPLQQHIGTYAQGVSAEASALNEEFKYNKQAGFYGTGGKGGKGGKSTKDTYDANDYDTNTANLQAIYEAASKSASEYNEQLRISSDYYKDLAAETNKYADSIIKTTDGKLTEEQAAQVAELRKTAEGYSDLSKKCGELASKEEALKAIQLQDELKGQQDSTIRLQENIKALQNELQLLTVGSDEYKAKVQEIKDAQADLSERTRDYADGSLADLNAKLSEAREHLSNATIGSQEYAEALAQVRDLTQQVADVQQAQQEVMMTSQERFAETTNEISTMYSSLTSLAGSFTNLSEAINGNANAFTIFMAAVQAAISIMNAINTVSKIFKASEDLSTASTIAHTAAETADTAAVIANNTAQTSGNITVAATNKAVTASALSAAAAEYAKTYAYIPFVGPAIAAGYAAEAVATAGAAYAAGLAFANGGVVPGNSWQGDRLFARVNSGETILNTDQAAYLNDQLDSIEGTGMQTPTARSVVTGEQLYQTITNWSRRTGKGELLFG